MTMPYGRKKVKKLLLEARMPADLRAGVPVVADAGGVIRWIPGVTGPQPASPKAGGEAPTVGGEAPQWYMEVNISREVPQQSDRGGPV
jgi:tRNA(Ile)-lysidine synthetase-like protein